MKKAIVKYGILLLPCPAASCYALLLCCHAVTTTGGCSICSGTILLLVIVVILLLLLLLVDMVLGVVQANVGQKLVYSNILRVFLR